MALESVGTGAECKSESYCSGLRLVPRSGSGTGSHIVPKRPPVLLCF